MTKKFNIIVKSISILLMLLCFSNLLKAQPQYFQRIYTTDIPSDLYFSDIANSGISDYILAGYGIVEFPRRDAIYLLKINSLGLPVWHKTIKDTLRVSRAHCMVKKNDKYIITGYADSVYTLCVDNEGNTLWLKKYFQAQHSLVQILNTDDNGFIACGDINNHQGLIIKTDSLGNLQWSKIFDAGYKRYFKKIIKQNNFYYLIGVRDDDINDFGNPVISRINLNGDSLVERKFSFPNLILSFESIIIKNDNLYLFGTKSQSGIYSRNFMLKCDVNFNLMDSLTINLLSSTNSDDILEHTIKYKDGFILQSNVTPNSITDTIYNEFKMLDSNFNVVKFNDYKSGHLVLNQLFNTSEHSIFSVGYLKQQKGITYNGYVIKMDTNFNSSNNVINIKKEELTLKDFSLSQNYPNPFNPSTKISYSLKKSSGIELKLFDASGRFVKLIQSGYKSAGSYEINFSSEGLSSGVYFISLFSDGILADTKKAVLLK